MQVKLLLFTSCVNGILLLHAVSIGKTSEQMSDFWTVRFLKIESEPNLGVSHIPTAGKAELNTNRHEQHQLYVHDQQKIRQKNSKTKDNIYRKYWCRRPSHWACLQAPLLEVCCPEPQGQSRDAGRRIGDRVTDFLPVSH